MFFTKKNVPSKHTKYEITDSFSTAQAFVYAALYGTLDKKIQSHCMWAQSEVGSSKRIISMWETGAYADVPNKEWNVNRLICLRLDNKVVITVQLMQHHNGDAGKEPWRVVLMYYPISRSKDYFVVIEPTFYFSEFIIESGLRFSPVYP